MADTFTSKLGLRQYDAALNYDVSKFSADNLLIDNAFGTIICTSTTRPSTGLFNGMQLWETDTRRFVVRVAGAWTVVPVRAIIADAAARTAITTPYDGMMIYRQDRDWTEVYDGAAWRVQGTAHCSSTSDRDSAITSPYNGQEAITTDTGFLWIRQAGAWTLNVRPTYLEARSSGDETVTTTETDVNGATLTFTTAVANTIVKVNSYWDVAISGGTDTLIGTLYVDGVKNTQGEAHMEAAGSQRETVAQGWTVTLASVGSHTLKLRRQKAGSSDTVTLYGIHTKIQVEGPGLV